MISNLHGKNACLIVDSECIRVWQFFALQMAIARGLKITCVIQCNNTISKKNLVSHFFYYVLNVFCFRNKYSKKRRWRDLLGDEIEVIYFNSSWVGVWQLIPEGLCSLLKVHKFDFVIKFGLSLLKNPDLIPSKYGVFSYHHGDPSFYRGRPAGFYELLHGASSMGVMVQRLNNKLDGGEVFAFCESKLFPHSYKKTLENAYGNGVYLLHKALQNAVDKAPVNKVCNGINYRLPSNFIAAYFISLLVLRKLKRLLYGALVEKQWRLCFVNKINILNNVHDIRLPVNGPHAIAKNHTFMADPIPYSDDTLFCEAMDKRSGNGVIIAIAPSGQVEVDMSEFGSGHFSYPFIVENNGIKYLLPEMSSVGSQKIGRINDDLTLSDVVVLKGLENERLKDPTLIWFDSKWFLFAGKSNAPPDALFLWHSNEILGGYIEHDSSPIVINPNCARPAGPIMNFDGTLFRLGQDNSGAYGNGVKVFCITKLSMSQYSEEYRFDIRMDSVSGPHTVCIYGDKYAIDYYRERISLFAGLIRVKGLLSKLSRQFRFV